VETFSLRSKAKTSRARFSRLVSPAHLRVQLQEDFVAVQEQGLFQEWEVDAVIHREFGRIQATVGGLLTEPVSGRRAPPGSSSLLAFEEVAHVIIRLDMHFSHFACHKLLIMLMMPQEVFTILTAPVNFSYAYHASSF